MKSKHRKRDISSFSIFDSLYFLNFLVRVKMLEKTDKIKIMCNLLALWWFKHPSDFGLGIRKIKKQLCTFNNLFFYFFYSFHFLKRKVANFMLPLAENCVNEGLYIHIKQPSSSFKYLFLIRLKILVEKAAP